jgi:hypothetical protein
MATKKAKTEGKQIDKAVQEARLAELAKQINEGHSQCMAAIRTSLERAREIGEALREVKKAVRKKNGLTFLEWIEDNCPFSECQAQRYMRIAKKWDAVQKLMNDEKDGDLTMAKALAYLSRSANSQKAPAKESAPEKLTIASREILETELNKSRKVDFDDDSLVHGFAEKQAKAIARQVVRLVTEEKELKDQNGNKLSTERAACAILRHVKTLLTADLLFNLNDECSDDGSDDDEGSEEVPSSPSEMHHRHNGKAATAVA